MVGLQAGRGEWFCALAWARVLGEQGRQADALKVLAPYLATGWWAAVVAAAELLEGWGRIDEAIEITRARMEAGHPMGLEAYTRLLARHGRASEAFTLLLSYADDWALATALVDVAAVAGRDEEAAVLLAARIGADHQCSDFPWCCRGFELDATIGLLATIRERQGRIDEAIALLRRRRITSVNNRDQLADVLARHGRVEELRAYAATGGHGQVVQRLAELLEEGGDVEGAIAAYGEADGPAARNPNSAYGLAQLLARHGRGDEAIRHTLSELCLDQGRPADGLAHLDALAAQRGREEEWKLFWMRLPLIAACSGVDEGVERARAHPEGTSWYAAEHIARLLADAGRTEEAVAVLQQHDRRNSHDIAGYLVDLGRVEESLTVFQHTSAPAPLVPTTHLWSEEPPF